MKKKPSTRGPRRPPVAGQPHFVRLTDDLLRRIEKHRLAMEGEAEGGVTKSDAIRDLIRRGLGDALRDLIAAAPVAHKAGCGTSARGCVPGCLNHDPRYDQ